LASTGLDADLAEAAQDLADERERQQAALAKTGQDLAEERERHTQTSQRAAAELAALRQTMKVADDTARATKHELTTALDAAAIRIDALEAANREAAIDREAAAKKFWTADQSVRVLMSPVVPASSNYSCVMPKSDGSAKVRLRFVVINLSPYEVRITGV